ncbi:hypothetical protein [Neofamilia massiliensis]|uniref:hypothetical protein n=1 Tax=Neofamilia massiliensis TaxID=1673724 RepID=UPI0006BB80E0|nr:hypothetical protein [Neofamilia massiliensis]
MRDLEINEDLFFISENFYKENTNKLKNQLVLPADDFFNSYKYGTVNNISNHEVWNIDFAYVIIAKVDWFENQNEDFRKSLSAETIKNGDGLVYKDEILTKNRWTNLDQKAKEDFFKSQDDEKVQTNLDAIKGFENLKKYHNHFPKSHGANCFASVLYAISKNEALIDEWIFADTFLLFLQANGYEKILQIKSLDQVKEADVLVLYIDGKLIHAFYCIDEKVCFNKFGQTMHEQWALLPITDVLKEFEGSKWTIYRKK